MAKRIPQSLSKNHTGFALLKTDIKQIYEILNEVYQEIRIKSDNLEFDSIEDFMNYDEEDIFYLFISCRGEVRVTVNKQITVSIIDSADTKQVGLYTRINSLIGKISKKRQRYIIYLYAIYTVWMSLALVVNYNMDAKIQHPKPLIIFIYSGLIPPAFSIIFQILYKARIKMNDKEGFWKRNHEKILINLIAGGILLILTLISNFFIKSNH